MADNILVNGFNIATNDVGGVHYQKYKQIDGRVGGTDGIPGSLLMGLWSDDRAYVTTAPPVFAAALRTVVTLKALNPLRRRLAVWNTSNEWLYLRYGAGASLALASVPLAPLTGYWETPFNCIDILTGIWGSTLDSNGVLYVLSGGAMVTEF